jgi:hypothetical protein
MSLDVDAYNKQLVLSDDGELPESLIIPDPISKRQQMIQNALGFTNHDLAENRHGVISSAQRNYLQKRQFNLLNPAILFGIAVVVLLILSPVVVLLLTFLTVVFLMIFNPHDQNGHPLRNSRADAGIDEIKLWDKSPFHKDLEQGIVTSVKGYVSLRKSCIEVNGIFIKTNNVTDKLFTSGDICKVYFTPLSETFLSLELISPAEKRKPRN